MQTADFSLFVAVWNRLQAQTTPDLHFTITKWLENMVAEERKRLLLMAFRGCGKSTLIGLYAAWRLYLNPNLRILVLSADDALARKMVRNVRRILERHILTEHLKPKYLDQWGTDRFTVVRSQELRDPSMLARGITSNMTGSRADIIICDDVEVPNTCDTSMKRKELRIRLIETDFILTPEGEKIFIGTPHTYNSIYTHKIQPDHEEKTIFLDNYERLHLPLITSSGISAWPMRFPLDKIKNLERSVGPNKFRSQMMLQPVNVMTSRLNPEKIQIYNSSILYVKELSRLEINNIPMTSASAWWDPAFGSADGDQSVLAIIFVDKQGQFYLHHVEILTLNETETDIARAQCIEVAKILKQMYVPSISLEINGLGRFLPSILRKVLAQYRVPSAVVEISSRRSKDLRILEAFDAVLAAESLHVNQSVMDGPFPNEMREWQPGRNKGRDDCLDAVAGALSQQPVRFGGGTYVGRQSWMGGGHQSQADTNFKV